MLEVEIPSFGKLVFKNVIFDYNGTIARDGVLIEGVMERLHRLSKQVKIHILTADTFGTVRETFEGMRIDVKVLESDHGTEEKLEYLRKLGTDRTIAVGNGNNDSLMLKESILGIAVVGAEGLARRALMDADLLFTDIIDVLDTLENPKRLVATLRE
jgi:soluble P-type ATPase